MPKTTKSRSDKKRTKRTKSRKTEERTLPVVEEKTTPAPAPTPAVKRTRRVVNKESVQAAVETLVARVNTEVSNIRESKTKGCGGVRFMRSVVRDLNALNKDLTRVFKQKTKTKRSNANSGFMKPVPISPEMAKFAGWDTKVPRSRVDVTKYLCDYIRQNKLQRAEDKRKINPDKKLRKLLGISSRDTEELTYFRLQQKIQHHFPKVGSS